MTPQPPNQNQYWDTNLDPTNLGAETPDAIQALRSEIQFASLTPDIQQMLTHVAPVQSKSGNPPTASNHNQTTPPQTNTPHQNTTPPIILDIGSGLGTAAALLRNRGVNVIAVDISHQRLHTMRQATNQITPAQPTNNFGLRVATTPLSTPHPAAHHITLPQPVPTPKIYAVKARAEALPFRTATLDGACSRAVLIHTDLPRAAEEISRILKPDAPIAFSEVMAYNPLVKTYRRTLAPREWQSITTYFTQHEIDTVTARFHATQTHRHYQLAFLAFAFQYALSSPTMFRRTLKLLTTIDKLITRLWPGFSRYAWFALIIGNTPQTSTTIPEITATHPDTANPVTLHTPSHKTANQPNPAQPANNFGLRVAMTPLFPATITHPASNQSAHPHP